MGPYRQDRAALVALTLLHGAKELGLTTPQLRARLNRGDSPSDVLATAHENTDPDDGLFAVPMNASEQASALRIRERLLADANALIDGWNHAGQHFATYLDEDYPQQLATAFDNPLVLFYAGTLTDDFASLAIVGSRKPSSDGLRFAASLATAAARTGLTVVAGLARGIDRAAHDAALATRGRTVAVIGTGLDWVYPPEHGILQGRIARDGLVVSQFSPGTAPAKSHFPIRNVTMSAYSALTVIVEADEKSGTRNQAEAAVTHGRPLVLTAQVATETTWGRKYLDEGRDVTVASTPDEAMEAVRSVLRRRQRVLQWAGVASAE